MSVIYGTSYYDVVDGLNGWEWEDAEAKSVQLGGNLVTLNTTDEWDWFKSEFTFANYTMVIQNIKGADLSNLQMENCNYGLDLMMNKVRVHLYGHQVNQL